MSSKEAVVFQSAISELKSILIGEQLTDEVANSLYQNKGIISLEEVLQMNSDSDEDKAKNLLSSLHQLIVQDGSQFETIMTQLQSFKKLQPVIQETRDKIWRNIPFIMKLLRKVPLQRNHRLGVELGISSYELSQIEEDNRGNSERIRMDIVQKWLHGDENITLQALERVVYQLSHPISSQITPSRVMIISVSIIVIVIAVCLAMASWNGTQSNFLFRNTSCMHDAIDHATIPRISGSKKYITKLPKLNQVVVGREEKVKEIVHNILTLNNSIIIVGKPGFGKSTLAIFAGNFLKDHQEVDVFIVDINDHFHDHSPTHEIESFYSIISEWIDERTRKTVLILDNFDKLLITERKQKIFQGKFLKMISSKMQEVSVIVTTQIEADASNNFHFVRAEELHRNASLQLLSKCHGCNIADEQKHHIAELVGDCPLALKLLVYVIDKYKSREGIEDPIGRLIRRLNQSASEQKINEEFEKNYVNYTDIMQIAYDHLDTSAQCCGCCVSQYPGSFSEKLFPLTDDLVGIPCNNSIFKQCVSKLVQNSLLDIYTLDEVDRYTMHTLIKTFFRTVNPSNRCDKSYRYMFSLYFTTYCALPKLYEKKDLDLSNQVLTSDYHHFQKLLLYIKAYGSISKYEAATLVIAYQRGEITSTRDYQLLYKALCQCEECVDFVISSIGNEVFGRVVMNVSSKLQDYNFARCELVTDNYCSKSLLYNPPSNYSTTHSLYNEEVLKITCTCYLMYYYHIIGTVGILGTLPVLLVLKYKNVNYESLKVDITTVAFINLNFLPSILKLYFGSDIEKIWQNVHMGSAGNAWIYTLFTQLLYEVAIIWFAGHMFQQRKVLYAGPGSIKLKNIMMLLILMGVPVAILQADLMGIYTTDAAKWNIGALLVLLVARSALFDYVASKISDGILLRFFFRLILSILNVSSEFSCRFIINTSLRVYIIFLIGSIPYTIVIATSTAVLLSYLHIL